MCDGLMTEPAGGGSRDRRIEDPSNLYLIHPTARALLPGALRLGVSANFVSMAGLACGAVAALCYVNWNDPRFALLGLVFSIAWLVMDGLDGMVARATGTSSAFGRFMDGLCDHGVFALLYLGLAASIGTPGAWALALIAAAAHAVQSSLYEGERARFHRRVKGEALAAVPRPTGNALVRLYDSVAGSVDRLAMPFERRLGASPDPVATGRLYGELAAPVMRFQYLLTANMRVAAIFLACLVGNPRLAWWYEIIPLSLVAAIGLIRHRAVERSFVAQGTSSSILLSSEQGHP